MRGPGAAGVFEDVGAAPSPISVPLSIGIQGAQWLFQPFEGGPPIQPGWVEQIYASLRQQHAIGLTGGYHIASGVNNIVSGFVAQVTQFYVPEAGSSAVGAYLTMGGYITPHITPNGPPCTVAWSLDAIGQAMNLARSIIRSGAAPRGGVFYSQQHPTLFLAIHTAAAVCQWGQGISFDPADAGSLPSASNLGFRFNPGPSPGSRKLKQSGASQCDLSWGNDNSAGWGAVANLPGQFLSVMHCLSIYCKLILCLCLLMCATLLTKTDLLCSCPSPEAEQWNICW